MEVNLLWQMCATNQDSELINKECLLEQQRTSLDYWLLIAECFYSGPSRTRKCMQNAIPAADF